MTAPSTQTSHPREVELLGISFAAIRPAELLSYIDWSLDRGTGGWVVTPNLHILRQLHRRKDLAELVRPATLVVADGTPLIWASRLQGDALPERVAGSDLAWSVPAMAAERGAGLFLLGGNPGAAELAARHLTQRYPRLRIVGTCCPPMGFDRSEEELERIERAVEQASPDIVVLGLPFPMQERLITRLRRVMPRAWYLGLGVSLSFIAGDVARAPTWMQRVGLEWAHRLSQEPRRLAPRYLVFGPPFALRLLVAALIGRWTARRHRTP